MYKDVIAINSLTKARSLEKLSSYMTKYVQQCSSETSPNEGIVVGKSVVTEDEVSISGQSPRTKSNKQINALKNEANHYMRNRISNGCHKPRHQYAIKNVKY